MGSGGRFRNKGHIRRLPFWWKESREIQEVRRLEKEVMNAALTANLVDFYHKRRSSWGVEDIGDG